MTSSITARYSSRVIRPTQGAAQRPMWKSRHGTPERRPGAGPSQGRYGKILLSVSSVVRTFCAEA